MSDEILPPKRPEMKVSWETMNEHYIPYHLRDYCAHTLIPLTQCYKKLGYWPWKCVPERHDYEVCVWEQYEYRRSLKAYLVKTGQWNNGRFPEVPPIVK